MNLRKTKFIDSNNGISWRDNLSEIDKYILIMHKNEKSFSSTATAFGINPDQQKEIIYL